MNPFTALVIVLVVLSLLVIYAGAWLFWRECRRDAPPVIGRPLVYACGTLTALFIVFAVAVIGFHSIVIGA